MKGPSVQAGTSAHRSALKEIGDSLEKMNRGAKASPVKDDPSKKELDKREKELKDAQKKQEKIDAEKEAGVISKEDLKNKEYNEKINKDGFLVAKKLLNRERDRTCPACFEYSFDMKDDLYMNRYDCCYKCYIQFVEGREERWSNLTERVEFLSSYYNRGEK